jgi:zinc-ribbon domain
MSGLMRRLNPVRRAAPDDETPPPATAASEPVGELAHAQQGGASVPANGVVHPGASAPTAGAATETPSDQPGRDLPAGVDPAELATAPSSVRRGKLRRRLRYLRAVRELLLRDLGGFYYEAQRSEPGIEPHRRLLDAKAARLATLDTEVRDLESHLELPHPPTVVRDAGIGGTCPQCGELHASDARFCSRCGTSLTGRGRTAAAGHPAKPAAAAPTAAGEEPKASTASLWGRPKRPEPAPPVKDEATAGNPNEADRP